MTSVFRYPQGLLLILLLVPALPLVVLRFRKTLSSLGALYGNGNAHRTAGLSLKRRFAGRTVLWSAAWILLAVSCAAPWIGEKAIPAGRRGKAAAFVFDISWSMAAEDVHPSRIKAASLYASALLERMEATPVSVILAKGGGITAIPLTEDYTVIAPLLGNLSPLLMSAPGTDLEKGVQAAAASLAAGTGDTTFTGGTIILFTDGDETLGSLEAAVTDAARQGMTVIFAGFGRQAEIPVITGDGVSTAMTSLKEKELMQIADRVNRRIQKGGTARLPGDRASPGAVYIEAFRQGSALEILDLVREEGPAEGMGYKMEPAGRAPVFAGAALLLFISGIAVSEFRPPVRRPIRKERRK
jgi:Ca-activated chloride channel family protein